MIKKDLFDYLKKPTKKEFRENNYIDSFFWNTNAKYT